MTKNICKLDHQQWSNILINKSILILLQEASQIPGYETFQLHEVIRWRNFFFSQFCLMLNLSCFCQFDILVQKCDGDMMCLHRINWVPINKALKIKYKSNIFYGATLSVQFEFDVFFKYNSVTQGSMSSIFFGQKDQTFDFPLTGFNARLVFRKREGTEIFEGGRKPDVIRIVKPPVIYIFLIGNHHSNNQTNGFPHVGIWIVSPI